MPLGDILAAIPTLTAQQIADFALAEDRERRRALARGDKEGAKAHAAELGKLCDAIRRAY
jgi:hypothetical protein